MGHAVLLVAHGSRDPRSAPVAQEVARLLTDADDDLTATACFLELSSPTPQEALADLAAAQPNTLTVAPFLLADAYHAGTDLPDVVTLARDYADDVRLAEVLGPDPLLLDALTLRLGHTDTTFDAVVAASAGSSLAEANTAFEQLTQRLAKRLGVPVLPAYASAARPTVDEAVHQAHTAGATRVAVVPYLLAPGFFADRVRDLGIRAGAVAVAEPLGACAPVVALTRMRARQARPAASARPR